MDTIKQFKRNGTFYRQRKKRVEKWKKIFQRSADGVLNCSTSNKILPKSKTFATSNTKQATENNFESDRKDYFDDIANSALESSSDEEIASFKGDNDHGDDDFDEDVSGERDLQHWAIMFNISHRAFKSLLAIMRTKFGARLPMDPRTLMQTSCNLNKQLITDIKGGQYWHNGIRDCLTGYFCNINESKTISININIDGIPLYKSSRTQFWPILFNIEGIHDAKPMPIGIFCGPSKPICIEEFLRPFINELVPILNNGILINGHVLHIKLRCFICDSPARAFIKGVASFNAINGCLKCTAEGEYSYEGRTVVFSSINGALRLDVKFRTKEYGKHHKGKTPLLDIPNFDMVEDVTIADSLHLLHLGVMKKLLIGWRDGKLGFNTKFSGHTIEHVNKN